ncbi:MAG: ribonuclease P protein component [Phycisphaerales bacterium]|nr:ribonuclease P protein component [Phycisphaerales bacterium]
MPEQTGQTFPRSARIRSRREFEQVFASGQVHRAGPLVIHGARNSIGQCRLGLAVGRRVGHAPRRNSLKRRAREAFRCLRHELPADLDLVVVIRPHAPSTPIDFSAALRDAANSLNNRLGT